MEALAIGEMGLTIEQFYNLTPREFDNAVKGYKRKKLSEFQNGWNQTREIMFTMAAPNLPKKYKGLRIEDFRPFAWDKKNKKPKRTKAEAAAIFKKWDKHINKTK